MTATENPYWAPLPDTRPIHLSTSASDVRCGALMYHWRDRPDGWDMGTRTVDLGKVTCPQYLLNRKVA